ncbi:MAG: hypothetical protein ACFBSC_05645 [Microcoleaceae cyanobacterium]
MAEFITDFQGINIDQLYYKHCTGGYSVFNAAGVTQVATHRTATDPETL